MPEPRRISDPDILKGLAQPMRQRLYRLLIQLGPATVSTLARKVDTDPGLVSYHLRELGRRGFIAEAPELAKDRRERWWRVVDDDNTWSTSDFTTPEGRAIAATVKGQMVADQVDRLGAWEAARDAWPADWSDAATSSNSYLRLDAAELTELAGELNALIARYGKRGAPGDDDGREQVFLFFHAFPERP
jgi:DNA-binding transcriptional ArsR family regulator